MEGPEPNHKLRAAREQKMWTIPEAAEEVGVDSQTYWRWENSVQRPRAYALRKLVAVFERPAEELGFRKGSSAGRDDAQRLDETRQEEASQEPSVEDSPIVRLTSEQAAVLLSLLEDATIMKTIVKQFDPAKRETLRTLGELFKNAGIALVGSQLVDPEMWERLSVAQVKPSALSSATLARFERYLGDCWELSNQNELETAEGILSSVLPRILVLSPREVTSSIAYLASQGLRLQSVLAHLRLNVSNKLLLCQQAVDYAYHADDSNTLVTALIELAAAFKFEGQPDKRLGTLQEALGHSVHASPLVQSRAYSNNASALAESGRVQEAQLYIKLARDVFPADPTGDPGFALADSSIFTLSYHSGKVYAAAGSVAEAFDAFKLYQQHSPGITIPERIRLEIVNAQSRVAIQAGDLERYVDCCEDALVGALALGSKKRFNETITIFRQEIPQTRREHGRVKSLAEQYHLENEG